MSTNPFDDPDGTFFVVANSQNQQALWPAFAPVPAGWRTTTGPASRQHCLLEVQRGWSDLRPAAPHGPATESLSTP